LTPIASHRSPPLYEIVKVINTISNNLYAENLLLTIGKETSGHGTLQHAEMAVRQTLEKAGVHLEGFRMADGSGLSRLNLITPHDTVELLYYMAKGAHAKMFMDSLAAPGNKGTLQRFSLDAPAPPAVKAKTGSMTNVRNLSGYITAANGELFAFSFLCNNSAYPAERVDSLYNRILRYVAETSFLVD
ncbi:MAG TPA: D-alanyl-D-alanine carboxypeptidase/D-alanyl-D-alanine-endopeptidase, partial [Syntrophorhabdaceae bacterium]|nr:D-alanyl-D-alanine carboxypeptidase/D-alanyl-D-alanine-endopeptidase [Syntrophorhabdaceae bacterium]